MRYGSSVTFSQEHFFYDRWGSLTAISVGKSFMLHGDTIHFATNRPSGLFAADSSYDIVGVTRFR